MFPNHGSFHSDPRGLRDLVGPPVNLEELNAYLTNLSGSFLGSDARFNPCVSPISGESGERPLCWKDLKLVEFDPANPLKFHPVDLNIPPPVLTCEASGLLYRALKEHFDALTIEEGYPFSLRAQLLKTSEGADPRAPLEVGILPPGENELMDVYSIEVPRSLDIPQHFGTPSSNGLRVIPMLHLEEPLYIFAHFSGRNDGDALILTPVAASEVTRVRQDS